MVDAMIRASISDDHCARKKMGQMIRSGFCRAIFRKQRLAVEPLGPATNSVSESVALGNVGRVVQMTPQRRRVTHEAQLGIGVDEP